MPNVYQTYKPLLHIALIVDDNGCSFPNLTRSTINDRYFICNIASVLICHILICISVVVNGEGINTDKVEFS